MVYLHKDPQGENALKHSSGSGTRHASKGFSTAATVATEHHDEITAMKQQISQLETKLAEVNNT